MKKIKLKILYKLWNLLVKTRKFSYLCEKINLEINKLESE